MHLELSVLAAFGAMLCWGFGDFFIQRTTRRVGDVECLAFIGSLGALGLLPFVLQEIPALLDARNMALMLLLGGVTFIAAVFNFEALKRGKLSVVEMILEIELPITVILGFMFFGESLTLAQLAAIGAVLAGIALIAAGSRPHKGLGVLEKGALLAAIAAVGMGFVNFLTAAGSKQISPLMAIWAPWLIVAVISFVALAGRDGIGKTMGNAVKFKWLILATAIFDTAAWLFFAFAVLDSMLSITIAITESYPAVAMLLGLMINRESIARHQYAGAGMALAASVALGFLI